MKKSFKKKFQLNNCIKDINQRYEKGRKTVAYLSRFYLHDAENGALYEKLVMDEVFIQLVRQYKYAKKQGSKKAMLNFYKAIHGNCFDLVCNNF